MLRKLFLPLLVVLAFACAGGRAETIQLKDKAAVIGKILAEKHDQVIVDLGFTVLTIPRSQITRILKADSLEPAPKPALTKTVASIESKSSQDTGPGFYSVGGKIGNARSVKELVNLIGEGVVQVKTPSGLGSGFIINDEGYLLTNFHVIEGETEISVEVYHQGSGGLTRKTYKQVRIIATNKFADLALLHIEDKDSPKFKSVVLGNAESLVVGDSVFAIGSPLGFERTVTEGIVSTKTRPMQGELYLQTTAQINPGNSGGPLFNMNGEVIGVTNMKIMFGEGLGFAIPIEAVKFFLDHRDAFAYSNDNPSNAYHYLQPPSHTRQGAEQE
ncbi:MAG: peptidase S1 [Verrucomicrobia bacterium]|nr:MAG: peptidase S1 [Verrucomicrobiota bacterium]